MKNFIYLVMIFFMTVLTTKAQVAINTTNSAPNNFSMLDISGSQKGILIPRVSTSDRSTMASSMSTTEEGLTVYDTDTQSYWFWDGVNWKAVGSGSMDNDWFKEGTVSQPTDINDKMYHLGQVAVGKNTADTQLDIYSDNQTTLIQAKLENPNDVALRLGASIDLDGTAITTHGKVGVYTTVGGDPGSASYSILEGYEAAVIGQDDVDKDQYGLYTYVTGNNNGTHVGLSTYLDGGSSGARYGNLNLIRGNSDGNNYLFYGYNLNNGDGTHLGTYNLMGGTGNGHQYGTFNRIWNSGTGRKVGTFNEIYAAGGGASYAHAGSVNLLGARIDPNNPSNVAPISSDGSGKRLGTVNIILGDGSGYHVGDLNNIISTGDGLHVGSTNVLGHDYSHDLNTTTAGLHFGAINNLTDTGDAPRIGIANLISVTVDTNNPTTLIPVTGDSDAARIGLANVIGGDGEGVHLGAINNLISTADGVHIGSSNILGLVIDTNNPTNPIPVVGDGNDKRVGEMNAIGGDGNGNHYGVINNIISTGDGEHIGVSNVIGLTAAGDQVSDGNGNHVGTENIIGGNGSGSHYGTVNHISSTGDGFHAATINRVNGSGNGLHVGSYNNVTNNGSGQHIAVYGEVEPTDLTAMAGVFKGDVTARNYITNIPFLSGRKINMNNSTYKDQLYVGAELDPTMFNKLGMIEVKMVIRIFSRNTPESSHHFRLHAISESGTNIYPIDDSSGTWTWETFDMGSGIYRYTMSSTWKVWNAGTDKWYLLLNSKHDGGTSISIDQVYLYIRPAQF